MEPFVTEECRNHAAHAKQSLRYELYAILVHHGTAYGGHYFALMKPPGASCWYEFNDRCVTEVAEEDMEAAFAAAATAAAASSPSDATPVAGDKAASSDSAGATLKPSDRIGQALACNAYLLFYRREDAAWTPSVAAAPPPDVVDAVAADNAAYAHLKQLHDIRARMVELSVFADGPTDDKVTIMLPGQATMRGATDRAIDAFAASGGAAGERSDLRLRRYDPMTAQRLDTYTGKDSETVSSVFRSTTAVVLLERRAPGTAWVEYDPNELMLRVARWDAAAAAPSTDAAMTSVVRVKGGKSDGTLGDLKVAIASAIGVPLVFQKLVEVNDRHARVLCGEERRLVGDLGVWPGTDIIVELMGPGQGETDDDSVVVAHYQQSRNAGTIVYNSSLGAPDGSVDGGGDGDFDGTLPVMLTDTLGHVKTRIAEAIGVEAGAFHIRRRPKGERLKDDTKTLREVHLSDGACLFLANGAPLGVDEYVLSLPPCALVQCA